MKEFWNNTLDIDGNEWHIIFSNCFNIIRETRLQYFQFKFIHKILPVNQYLTKLKILDSSLCSFCDNASESLEHLFWSCEFSFKFWNELYANALKDVVPNICFKVIAFGFLEKDLINYNYIIFHAKYFLFWCKCNDKIPSYDQFRKFMKTQLSIEENFRLKKVKFMINL